ncbi:MAG: arsenite methyltransferase [Bacteroidota bacterium]
MTIDIKEIVKQSYTQVVLDNGGCGCSPTCCYPDQESTFNESYLKIDGYLPDADLGLGCGLPTEFANIKIGETVLDLGAGAGNDVFVVRSLVGESGKVIGLDMTEAMVDKAIENNQKLGYNNIEFILGEIENIPLADNSIDVVVSNCVMNLVPDKTKAYSEVYRVLVPKGHFSISDIVLGGDIPDSIRNAAEMYAGCVSGALSKVDYIQSINDAGFSNVKVVKERQIVLPDDILLKYLSNNELLEFRKQPSPILSVTVYAEKN